MAWTSVAAIYVIVWWLVLFMTLPFGVHREESPEPGHDAGAPVRPLLWIKAGVTTLIAAAVTAILWLLIEQGVFDMRPPV